MFSEHICIELIDGKDEMKYARLLQTYCTFENMQ